MLKNHELKIMLALTLVAIIMAVWLLRGNMAEATGDSFAVTLSVRADTLLENMHLLNPDSQELIPADGVIFHGIVTAYENDSVFDVLNREMRSAGIHFVFRQLPVFDSAYVQAINNLFEFDAGALSGWKYRVNGEFPGIGASLYIVQPGDKIEWLYTIDLGRDIGAIE